MHNRRTDALSDAHGKKIDPFSNDTIAFILLKMHVDTGLESLHVLSGTIWVSIQNSKPYRKRITKKNSFTNILRHFEAMIFVCRNLCESQTIGVL